MNMFTSFSLNTFPEFLTKSLWDFDHPMDSVAVLVCGALLGYLTAWSMGPLLNYISAGLVWIWQWTLIVFALLLQGALMLKDSMNTAATWKTYKKVMPWRHASRTTQRSMERCLPGSSNKTDPDWYGTEQDIEFFLKRISDETESKWKCICQNELGDILTYKAFCRPIQGNKTEYKSVTIVKDATAQEMTDFYLNDELRKQWDSVLAEAEPLEVGPGNDRCEVVRWVRSFPFPFLSDREYVIGRRIFRKDGVIYTVSRGIEHAAAPVKRSLIRMDVYYSMWSCRDVPCPWGTDQPACEVVLLHHEQFKIPEKLARFAACKGMWGFIRVMGPAVVNFIQAQREANLGLMSEIQRIESNGDENTISQRSRNGKSGKFMRTARRALFATIVTTLYLMRRHQNQKQS